MTDTPVDRAQRYLMASAEEMQKAGLPSYMQARLLRLREMYAYWLQNPRMVDKDIVGVLRQKYGLTVASLRGRALHQDMPGQPRAHHQGLRPLALPRTVRGGLADGTRGGRRQSLCRRHGHLSQGHAARQGGLCRSRLFEHHPAAVRHIGRPRRGRLQGGARHHREGKEARGALRAGV